MEYQIKIENQYDSGLDKNFYEAVITDEAGAEVYRTEDSWTSEADAEAAADARVAVLERMEYAKSLDLDPEATVWYDPKGYKRFDTSCIVLFEGEFYRLPSPTRAITIVADDPARNPRFAEDFHRFSKQKSTVKLVELIALEEAPKKLRLTAKVVHGGKKQKTGIETYKISSHFQGYEKLKAVLEYMIDAGKR